MTLRRYSELPDRHPFTSFIYSLPNTSPMLPDSITRVGPRIVVRFVGVNCSTRLERLRAAIDSPVYKCTTMNTHQAESSEAAQSFSVLIMMLRDVPDIVNMQSYMHVDRSRNRYDEDGPTYDETVTIEKVESFPEPFGVEQQPSF